jgi:hypothetical protein
MLVAAMALYLESLADTLPELDASSVGGRLFARECARCHAPPSLADAWIPVAEVGTEPLATMGERGTGGYRAPSLLGVGDRRGLLHDGSATDLRAILRLDPSEHVGHAFGLDLSVEERDELVRALTDP